MTNMKKKDFLFVICLLLVLVLIFPLRWTVAFWGNNAALKRYEKEVTGRFVLTEDMAILDVVSGCGNTAGTSNGVELYVGILIRTSLSEDSLKELYTVEEGVYAGLEEITNDKAQTRVMYNLDLSFSYQIEEDENYYVVEFFRSAPFYQSDLRGH
ncbi:MAG: hypothetical protein IJP31_05080 [Lachnospiraceae bacterium]|nr:hypothetical protein [Lachnospiraceae bacterium]